MTFPKELEKAIENASLALPSQLYYDLPFGYRHAIWTALGPYDRDIATIGKKRRALLAIITASFVLPIWEQNWPNDGTPREVLILAQQILENDSKSDKAELWDRYAELWEYFTYYSKEGEEKIISSVGNSTVAALATALNDETFNPNNIDYNLTDRDVEIEQWDTSFYAACAYANGPIWVLESNSTKRREFWEWWLKEAIPEAWNLAAKIP